MAGCSQVTSGSTRQVKANADSKKGKKGILQTTDVGQEATGILQMTGVEQAAASAAVAML